MPCPLPGSLSKKDRVIAARQKDPNLSYSALAERFDVGLRTVKTWLAPTGLGQARTEDGRGQKDRDKDVGYGNLIRRLDADQRERAISLKAGDVRLEAYAVAADVGTSINHVNRWWREAGLIPRNVIDAETSPESL